MLTEFAEVAHANSQSGKLWRSPDCRQQCGFKLSHHDREIAAKIGLESSDFCIGCAYGAPKELENLRVIMTLDIRSIVNHLLRE